MGKVVPLGQGKFPTRDAVVFSAIILSNWRTDVWDPQEGFLAEPPRIHYSWQNFILIHVI